MLTVRRVIRIKAFQTLFQLATNPELTKDKAISYALSYPIDEIEQELEPLEAMKQNLPKKDSNKIIAADALAYFEELVNGVIENEEFLDEQIEKRLTNWSIERLESPTLVILRIATYELFYQEEIDPRIVLNEAIELTKSFNNEDASKFVNGVLQGILDTKEA